MCVCAYMIIHVYVCGAGACKGPGLVLKMHTLVVMLLQCLSCCGKTWGGGGGINVLSAYVLTCDVHTRATLIMGGGGGTREQ